VRRSKKMPQMRAPTHSKRVGCLTMHVAKSSIDGGAGLLAALPGVFHGIPVQRCWAHKIRNVLDKVKKIDQPAVKRALHKVMNAAHEPAARSAARRLAQRFLNPYPAAVACLRNDLDQLLTCFRDKSEAKRRAVRTPRR
jgi:putative transposase